MFIGYVNLSILILSQISLFAVTYLAWPPLAFAIWLFEASYFALSSWVISEDLKVSFFEGSHGVIMMIWLFCLNREFTSEELASYIKTNERQ